jgi:hypothetical protein
MPSLISQTDIALNAAPASSSTVVLYHFWSFVTSDGSVDPVKIAWLETYINHLKDRGDVIFTTLDNQPLMDPSPAPAVYAPAGNGLDVFAQGAYHALWDKGWNATAGWSSWEYLGGYLTSSPAATSPGDGSTDVFVRGGDGAIWYKEWNGAAWSSWPSLGGQIPVGTGPAACAWSAGRLDVFVEGTNGALHHKAWTGTSWTTWQNLGWYLTSSLGATSPSSGTIDVFVRGSDNGLWQKAYNSGAWGSWTSIGDM